MTSGGDAAWEGREGGGTANLPGPAWCEPRAESWAWSAEDASRILAHAL